MGSPSNSVVTTSKRFAIRVARSDRQPILERLEERMTTPRAAGSAGLSSSNPGQCQGSTRLKQTSRASQPARRLHRGRSRRHGCPVHHLPAFRDSCPPWLPHGCRGAARNARVYRRHGGKKAGRGRCCTASDSSSRFDHSSRTDGQGRQTPVRVSFGTPVNLERPGEMASGADAPGPSACCC
jgi:hypothetical protein